MPQLQRKERKEKSWLIKSKVCVYSCNPNVYAKNFQVFQDNRKEKRARERKRQKQRERERERVVTPWWI